MFHHSANETVYLFFLVLDPNSGSRKCLRQKVIPPKYPKWAHLKKHP